MNKDINKNPKEAGSIFGLLKSYKQLILLLVLLSLASNGFMLWMPKIVSHGINAIPKGLDALNSVMLEFLAASFFILIFSYLTSIVQTLASERVARDLRSNISAIISKHSHLTIQKISPSKLLTILTQDVDSIKNFVGQAVASLVSSVFTVIGAAFLLLTIDWKLGLAVLAVIPFIGIAFYLVMGKLRSLFLKTRQITDKINRVINESILGSALIRVLSSRQYECQKFQTVNTEAKDTGLDILKIFAVLIPIITFTSNIAILIVLSLGGHFVIAGSLSLGDFAAFNGYITLIIFPILVISFMSNVIAQAQSSYTRINEITSLPIPKSPGTLVRELDGNIEVENLSFSYQKKPILKNISISIKAHTRTAIIGPTAAGKTQLLYLLVGLLEPDTGQIKYDGHNLSEYSQESLHKQLGLVFQDSIIFNMSLRENIAFSSAVSEEGLNRAIETAELDDFINNLPDKLETIISERGTSLSGGQKQRIMLARALALEPKILLLDDFTARVDNQTEESIMRNISKNYPDLCIVSITQKIDSAKDYDQIILIMEGELIATGKHETLLQNSPEYIQIYESQRSTNEE